MMSESASDGTKFSPLDADLESGSLHAARNSHHLMINNGMVRGQRTGACATVKTLRLFVAGLSLLTLVLIIALAVVATKKHDGTSSTPSPSTNPDPPYTLPGAVQVANIMNTLKDLEGIAANHNGSRYDLFITLTYPFYTTLALWECVTPP